MPDDIARLLEAASFAAEKHRDQRRKDAEASPYINHPLKVATTLAIEGGVSDIELLIAALLHDTVEDTETSLQEIEDLFGPGVRDLVAEVTDDKTLPKPQRKQLQIDSAAKKSGRAKQLKLADKTCNIGDLDADRPATWDRERKIAYLRWARDVVEGCRGSNPKLEQLFDQSCEEAERRIDIKP